MKTDENCPNCLRQICICPPEEFRHEATVNVLTGQVTKLLMEINCLKEEKEKEERRANYNHEQIKAVRINCECENARLTADLAKVTADAKRYEQGIMANAPKCGACAEYLFTGSCFHEHDADCPVAERDSLRARLSESEKAFNSLLRDSIKFGNACENENTSLRAEIADTRSPLSIIGGYWHVRSVKAEAKIAEVERERDEYQRSLRELVAQHAATNVLLTRTGATYTNAVAERDSIQAQLAEAWAERDHWRLEEQAAQVRIDMLREDVVRLRGELARACQLNEMNITTADIHRARAEKLEDELAEAHGNLKDCRREFADYISTTNVEVDRLRKKCGKLGGRIALERKLVREALNQAEIEADRATRAEAKVEQLRAFKETVMEPVSEGELSVWEKDALNGDRPDYFPAEARLRLIREIRRLNK